MLCQYDASKKVTAQYVHGSGLGGDVGSLLFSQTLIENAGELSLETSYYLHNHRGDVVAVTNEAGTKVNTYRYSAFGEIIDQTTQRENDILFSSKKLDSSTSLSYFGARYYDASLGRFISRDPMGYIDGPNGYIYVSNSPINLIDPFGMLSYKHNPYSVGGTLPGYYLDSDKDLELITKTSASMVAGVVAAVNQEAGEKMVEKICANGEYLDQMKNAMETAKYTTFAAAMATPYIGTKTLAQASVVAIGQISGALTTEGTLSDRLRVAIVSGAIGRVVTHIPAGKGKLPQVLHGSITNEVAGLLGNFSSETVTKKEPNYGLDLVGDYFSGTIGALMPNPILSTIVTGSLTVAERFLTAERDNSNMKRRTISAR